jgi:hypothetical protein
VAEAGGEKTTENVQLTGVGPSVVVLVPTNEYIVLPEQLSEVI